MPDADVIIVGAGPTGLLVATELALAGVRALVLEKKTAPDPTIKAGSINVATAEILDRRGMGPAARAAQQRFVATMTAFAQARLQAQPAPSTTPMFPNTGHFAGIFFRPELVDQGDPELIAHRGVDGSTVVPQVDVEAILGERARELGVEIRRGVAVGRMREVDDHAELETSDGTLTAAWVVAADGGRSPLRKQTDIAFPGTDAEVTGYQAIADLEGAERLRRGWNWSPTGVYSYGPQPGRILTVQFTGPPTGDRTVPVSAEEMQRSIRLVSGVDVTVTALRGRATRWADNARQAETYRAGRLLLAGDAAHVHSPFSGQGLNLGAGDAVNLGWKLAAVVKGESSDALLDTYTTERHPIGEWVLDWTRAQVALMRGDTKTHQLRDVVANELLGTTEATTRIVKLTAGIAQRFDVSDEADAHPLVGGPIGDLPLGEGAGGEATRLAEHFHAGRFVLLDRTGSGAFAEAAAPWKHRLEVVRESKADSGCPALYASLTGLLVRPDGVIIWASEQSAPDVERLTAALRRWA